jgi:hypothetical protein
VNVPPSDLNLAERAVLGQRRRLNTLGGLLLDDGTLEFVQREEIVLVRRGEAQEQLIQVAQSTGAPQVLAAPNDACVERQDEVLFDFVEMHMTSTTVDVS